MQNDTPWLIPDQHNERLPGYRARPAMPGPAVFKPGKNSAFHSPRMLCGRFSRAPLSDGVHHLF